MICRAPAYIVPTEDVEHEADKSVMGRERHQNLVNQDDVFEVVDDALPV